MPPLSVVFSTWAFSPVAAVFLAALALAYGLGVIAARRKGASWGVWPVLAFYVLGLGSYAAVSFGVPGAYTSQLRWAFVTRIALLLFLVPWLLALGRPVALLEASLGARGRGWSRGFWEGRVMRVLGNALFEPFFTVALFLLFVTPFSAWLRTSALAQNAACVVIPLLGLLTVLPLAESTKRHTSFNLAGEFMLAMGALIFDAVPAILIRLHSSLIDGLNVRLAPAPAWFPSPLRDQQLSGDILWFIAEVADIPVIIILFLRWSRVDRDEARAIDELSDEEMEALTRQHLGVRDR